MPDTPDFDYRSVASCKGESATTSPKLPRIGAVKAGLEEHERKVQSMLVRAINTDNPLAADLQTTLADVRVIKSAMADSSVLVESEITKLSDATAALGKQAHELGMQAWELKHRLS